jgi:hypothetical protein
MAQESRHALGNVAPQTADQAGPAAQPLFVINLCTLAAPITVPQPRASRLTRYSFFLSHFWADGHRQYRLHMGHFQSTAEAEKWLVTLKRVYPSAYVSEAPQAQPDLMGTTQRLRVLQIGQIGDSHDRPHGVGASNSLSSTPAQKRPGAVGSAPMPSSVKSASSAQSSNHRGARSLEETLEELKTSEFDMGGDDDLNATGVRHLRFEVQKEKPVAHPSQRSGARTRR